MKIYPTYVDIMTTTLLPIFSNR